MTRPGALELKKRCHDLLRRDSERGIYLQKVRIFRKKFFSLQLGEYFLHPLIFKKNESICLLFIMKLSATLWGVKGKGMARESSSPQMGRPFGSF
jgi:hypothetical protein